MYLAYLDDSASADGQFQVVGGILLKDADFDMLEQILGFVVEMRVPAEFQADFEFHSSELWQQRGAFRNLPRDVATQIMDAFVELVSAKEIPVVWGAVDLDRHKESIWGSASPLAVGFKICLDEVERWLSGNAEDDFAIAIFDSINKPELRNTLVTTFRDNRRSLREIGGTKGQWAHLHDDLYFGDSRFSAGLQAADLCAYLVNRHLRERLDTEGYYKQIEPSIIGGKLVP